LERWVAIGMFLLCVAYAVNNTILQGLFSGNLTFWFHENYISYWPSIKPLIVRANDWWNTVRTFAFIASMGIWCFALRKPLPAPSSDPILLPQGVYNELNPEVNLRLRAFNERLLEMLRS
jgi:hypothetical protein